MKTRKEITHYLNWQSKKYGVCQANFTDGELTHFEFRRSGSSFENGILEKDFEYLKELHAVLGELIEFEKGLKP